MTAALSSLPERKLTSVLQQCGLMDVVLRQLMVQYPFADDDTLCEAVDGVFRQLDDAELALALAAEADPAIESGSADACDATRLALRLYRDRFGYPYVSSITAPAADELLMRVRIRLGNEPAPEGRAAREHLRRLIRGRIQAHTHATGEGPAVLP